MARAIAASDIELVWLSIALHTSRGIPGHLHPVIALLTEGVVMDVFGVGYDAFPASQRDAVVRAAMAVAERINQLGGWPDFNPHSLTTRSATQYVEGENLVDMIRENLIAERIVIDHYRELIRFFGANDPTTRVMLEGILADEEDHAGDMHDLLVAHEGTPMLPGDHEAMGSLTHDMQTAHRETRRDL
jgi:bacterioferritin (cytochrome b1)